MRSSRPFHTLVRRLLLASLVAGPGAAWGDDANPQATPTTSQAAANPPLALRLKRFEIPFSVDSVGTRPVEVQLFVSRDGGNQWSRFGSQKPDGKSFLFEATEDGPYWFATRTLDGAGNAHPQGPITPQLHVLVDATDPQIELSADLNQEAIVQLSIRCFDSTLKPDTLRVEYRTDVSSAWTGVPGLSQLVPATGSDRMEGSLSFEPAGNWHQVSVRVIVKDGAGNQTISTHQLERARTASLQGQLASAPLQGGSPLVGPGPNQAHPNYAMPGAAYPGQSYPPTVQPGYLHAGAPYAGNMSLAPTASGSVTSVVPMVGPNPAGPHLSVGPYPGTPQPMQNYTGQPYAGQPFAGQPNPYAVKAMEIVNPLPGSQATMPSSPANGLSPSDVLPVLQSDASTNTTLMAPGQSSGSTVLNPAASRTPGVAPETPIVRGPSTSLSQAMRPMSPEDLNRPQSSPGIANPGVISVGQGNPGQGNLGQGHLGQGTQTMTRPSIPNGGASMPPAASTVMPRLDETTSTSPIRFSGSRKFSLDYEVEAAGRAGVEEVELWGSSDRGRTWKRWGADPDRQSPFDIETNNDGVYGFSIVVVSKNGLATPRPLEQSPPDVFVVVDTSKPQVRITGANYGEGDQTGALLIRYECLDDNLGARPIALSFSDSYHGPWTTIAAGLENRGGYAWPADPQLPRQIYLRIDATDQAGNASYQVLDTPIDVQGLAPRARIRGLNPISATPTPSYMQPQTASGQSLNLR